MKSSKQWIHRNVEFKKMPNVLLHMYRVNSIYSCNVGDERDNDDLPNTVSSNINMDNIETEGSGTVSDIVRFCDSDV